MSKPLDATEVNPADRLAFERTRLAYERTTMAWIRTATSLITFGFAVYKFFQFETSKSGPMINEGVIGPRGFSLAMISLAVFALFLAGIGHRRDMQALRAQGVVVPRSMAAVLAGLVAMFGVLVLIAVWLRL